MQFLTLAKSNMFSFTCPIFDAQVQMRSCVILRDKYYRGERVEVRRGCQACMSSGKCPAADIVRRIAFGMNDATDHCSSPEPRTGRLPADTLERIRPVLVTEVSLTTFRVPQAERALIASAGQRIDAQLAGAPRTVVSARLVRKSAHEEQRQTRPAPISAPVVKAPSTAAATGDLAAAINAA